MVSTNHFLFIDFLALLIFIHLNQFIVEHSIEDLNHPFASICSSCYMVNPCYVQSMTTLDYNNIKKVINFTT
jgi:hypothetical protein